MQLAGHIFAGVKTFLDRGHSPDEQGVDFLVQAQEFVARLFEQGFLEGEMRFGVVDHVMHHAGQHLPIGVVALVVQGVDVVHDAKVLAVDFRDAGVQVGCPDEMTHIRSGAPVRPGIRRRAARCPCCRPSNRRCRSGLRCPWRARLRPGNRFAAGWLCEPGWRRQRSCRFP